MKIGILTFHAAHNYGSMLLAYALQEVLKSEGHEVKIINHRIYAQNMMYANPMKFTHKLYIKTLLRHPLIFMANAQKWKKFESFSMNYHNLTKLCPTLVDVENIIKDERFNAVITGGDQIWNMQCSDFSLAYYLPFDIPGVKKVSYSSSFGGGGFFKPENYGCSIRGLLQDYDHVSVREMSASLFLSELLGHDVQSVCDPTLLLEPSRFSELAGKERLIKEAYIFYYSPFSTPKTEEIALGYGKKLGLPVYTSNGQSFQCKGMKRYQKSGPIEFLNFIKHAEMVCGNSFHLAVFSILLQKEFFVLSKADARMETLLNDLGIPSRFCSSVAQIDVQPSSLDWQSVLKKIDILKSVGINYLKKSLL